MRALPIGPGGRAAAAAGVLTLAVDCLYLGILRSQSDPTGSRQALVSASLAAASALALSSVLLAPTVRAAALGWTTGTLLLWAFLGAASIGLLLVPAAALTLVALARGGAGARAQVAAALGLAAALAVVAAGIAWTG